jgi:hypothetical protein
MKYLLLPLFMLAGCSPQPVIPPKEESVIQATQDMESCARDSDTPWCASACKTSSYSWCPK